MTIPPKRKPLRSEDERKARKNQATALCKQRKKQEDGTGLKIRPFNPATVRPPKPRKQAASSPSDSITHEKQRDLDFRQQVLKDIQRTLDASKHLDTWGRFTASEVKDLLSTANPPTTNLEPGVSNDQAQALFLTTEQAKNWLGSGRTVSVPIFTRGQQDFAWSTDSRPISQLLAKYTTPDEKVDVNIASLSRAGVSYTRKTTAEMRTRFAENIDHEDAWNVLDVKVKYPKSFGFRPKFLRSDNCDLLTRIEGEVTGQGWAGRATIKAISLSDLRDVELFVLLGEPRAYTGRHTDSNAYETFITSNEGEIGLIWWDRPSKEQLQAWAEDPSGFRGGDWCFSVLRPGHTAWFPSGFVHSVCRRSGDGNQTMGIGGHMLRCSAIAKWAETLAFQLSYPNVTNEKMTTTAPKYLQIVIGLVIEAAAEGRLEEFGGRENVVGFRRRVEVILVYATITPAFANST